MTTSGQSPSARLRVASESRRAGRELVLEWVFQPLSSLLVPVLRRLGIPPPAVVVANATVGLLAAVAIARGAPVVAAVLLQVKTLLDNCDGRLARVTGRVTLAGRYLDTLADLVVNAAVFVALGYATGQPLLAFAAFVALSVVLTVDFNLSELGRAAHGSAQSGPRTTGGRAERVLESVYAITFAPQDRLVREISEKRLERVAGPDVPVEARRAYFDGLTLAVLANLGLTTQLAVLGVCLVLGAPTVYLWLAVASLVALAPLQLRRERLAERAARR